MKNDDSVLRKNRFDKISDEEFIKIFNNAILKSDIIKYFHLSENGTSRRFINNKIKELNLDILYKKLIKKHLNKYVVHMVVLIHILEVGENNGRYSNKPSYIKICFKYHPHKCCICGEENIVAVHHYDGNHYNDDPCNLAPLCSTHHNYWHSKYKDEIINIIDKYIEQFKK